MEYAITGLIREKESGRGVAKLQVRAYDRDLLHDDLLGTAITDADGKFEMRYSEKDFQELFDRRPDIYLAVYSATCTLLMSTKECVRWNATPSEHFELELSRQVLGDDAPAERDDEVAGNLKVKAGHLEVVTLEGFSDVRLPGFTNFDAPGAPSLPNQIQYVVLPKGGDVLDLEINPGKPVIIRGIENPYPAQAPVPDLGLQADKFGDGFTHADTIIQFTPLRQELERQFPAYPPKLVEIKGEEEKSALRIARIKVSPVQYHFKEKAYYFYPDLSYRVKFDKEKAERLSRQEKREIGVFEAELINDMLTTALTARARDLLWPRLLIWEEAPHVIITDNYYWPDHIKRSDGTLRPPALSERGAALSGDLRAEFERLAQWKTSKGVKSKVVLVSDIVSGYYGDRTQGGFARDLPEVIRNFVKFIHKTWKTRYLLIGGDHNVVPIRKLTGSTTYPTVGTSRSGTNPPEKTRCHILNAEAAVKIYPDFTPQPEYPLSTYHGGLRIPFDREAGRGRLGWYYTSEADFTNKNTGFRRLDIGEKSQFIIVEGPPSVLDDDYYWLKDENTIPSDFYYSALEGTGFDRPGKHDFDLNNNELYGQYHYDGSEDVSHDQLSTFPDVFVGRASVESGAEAKGFVDKTITYERLIDQDGNYVDTSYLKKVIYGADLWWGPHIQGINLQADISVPPGEGLFTHAGGATQTRIHLGFDITMSGGAPSHRLFARRNGADTLIPYNNGASAGVPGWYFTTNNTYNVQSAAATRFVLVRGNEPLINPNQFLWDTVGMEGGVAEKEALRALMNGWFPAFDNIQRHYADYYDLASPPPLQRLDETAIRNAIEGGVHLLSLTGHGWWGGCCGLNTYGNPNFTNKNRYFIAFADSCSTARLDDVDATAEIATNDPDGGAVAYVGNTRYSWIGPGHHFEKFFWNKLSVSGRPGVAAGFRMPTGGTRWLWIVYAQNLFGDPELKAYTKMPPLVLVFHPDRIKWGSIVKIELGKEIDLTRSHYVTLSGGWNEKEQRPLLHLVKQTTEQGIVSFRLPDEGVEGLDSLTLTVSGRDHQMYIKTIPLDS